LRDNIQFNKDLSCSKAEQELMAVLRWKHVDQQADQATRMESLLAIYNELARKFLIEGRY